MAIIIQENQNKGVLVSLVIGVLVLAGGAFLTYYLFFSPTPLAEDFAKPDSYEDVSLFAKANLDTDSVLNSPTWRFLEKNSPINPIITGAITPKTNLFQVFVIGR